MTIDTERLTLIPLTARQLRLWAEDMASLERELDCRYSAEPLEGFFLQIVQGQIAMTAADEAHYLYHTFWLLLRKADRVVLGSADFKVPPNKAQEVEIGYGLGKIHEGHGYMTEAVRAMCDWALAQEGVAHVIAETEPDNQPSENVLIRCGFIKDRQEETIWWRL